MFDGLDVVHAHPARRWTAIASFTLQAAFVGAALMLPLIKPESLPEAFALRPIFRPLSQGVERPVVNQRVGHNSASQAPVYPLIVNRGPSVRVTTVGPVDTAEVGPPQIGQLGDPSGVINSVLIDNNARPLPHPPVATHAQAAPVSVIMEGNLVHKVEPRYPVIAQQVGIQGAVVIRALISRTGNIERAQVESGQPLLTAAALAAVREWKYRPYYLNGEPVEVETEITVNFILRR
ncbi:MAG TPA: energy transducer TonB [Terriglobales bacterium]